MIWLLIINVYHSFVFLIKQGKRIFYEIKSVFWLYLLCLLKDQPSLYRYYIQYILVLCIRKIFTVSGIRRRLTERYNETFSIVSKQIILFLLHRPARENQNILSRFKSYNLLILCTKTLKQIILCQNPYNTLFCAKIPRTNYSVPKSL